MTSPRTARRSIVALVLGLVACRPAGPARPLEAGAVAATIDGRPLLWDSLETRRQLTGERLRNRCRHAATRPMAICAASAGEFEEYVAQLVLERAVDERLVVLEAERLGITPNLHPRALQQRVATEALSSRFTLFERDVAEFYEALARDWPSGRAVRVQWCEPEASRTEQEASDCPWQLAQLRILWIARAEPPCNGIFGMPCPIPEQSVDPEVRRETEQAGHGRVTAPFWTAHGFAIAQSVGGELPTYESMREYFRRAFIDANVQRMMQSWLQELRVKYRVTVRARAGGPAHETPTAALR